ncbi:hypothetical protein KVL81_04530 [Helicobacter pylori]|nr:hypothetical protein KVL81_04530 [Helicobacter pylori]
MIRSNLDSSHDSLFPVLYSNPHSFKKNEAIPLFAPLNWLKHSFKKTLKL